MPSDLPELRRHLFLTGEKQVGKSTLLRRLMEQRGIECTGFETRVFYADHERRGFTLHGRVEMPPYRNDCICCARIEQKRSVPVLPVFEENGVLILRKSLYSSAPFILMDELGKLESQAHEFVSQVYACLNSDKRVIGVLQKCDSPHVAQIMQRHDVTVLTVTPENREQLLAQLLNCFC